MYYKLIRQPKGPTEAYPNDPKNAVRGMICVVQHRYSGSCGEYKEYLTPVAQTLENADYLIPALVYRVVVTMSPKFGRLLPLLQQVPNRSGIRIHRGCLPEHSEGCVLVSRADEQLITAHFLTEQRSNAPIYLEITN